MCIIIAGKIKDIKRELFESILEEYLKMQGDGWGIYLPPNLVYKTLDFNKFKKYVTKKLEKINKEEYAVIHGRDATSGDKALYNTHPILFYSKEDLITDQLIDEIEIKVSKKELLLFHNGIIEEYNNISNMIIIKNKTLYEVKEKEKYKFNDTKSFVEKIKSLPYNKILEKIQEKSDTNRFALINIKEQSIVLFGTWHKFKDIYTSVYVIETKVDKHYPTCNLPYDKWDWDYNIWKKSL